jgi:hypothetical protein
MELTIPLQTFETQKVKLGSPIRNAKLLAPFAYSDGDLQFHQIALLLPILPVKSYHADTGKLAISFHGGGSAGIAGTKLQAFQDMMITALYHQQRHWFPGERHRGMDELRAGFQPMFDHGLLHLYCPCASAQTNGIPLDIQIYDKRKWTQGPFSPSLLQPGSMVRLLVKIQGISFHKHPVSGMWTGRFRIQHRVSAIFMCGESGSANAPPKCLISEEP